MVMGLQTPGREPVEFIQHLAIQSQLIACLKWLSEFQVLACIPMSGSISISEVAELASVPERQLARVVRMTATSEFLHEPQPGHIAHTPLSAPFVTNLAFLDAAMFLAETAAPTALQMAGATQQQHHQSAYSVAFPASPPFLSACGERAKLQRQWSAYRRCVGDVEDGVAELVRRLKWRSLGNACVVDVCASSTEAVVGLAEAYPSLHFIVQLVGPAQDINDAGAVEEFGGRVTIQRRLPAAVQEVTNAAIYLLRLSAPSTLLATQILGELRGHLNVLRETSSATLILALPLLPEPKTVTAEAEAKARVRDLCRLQLTEENDMELSELVEIINSVGDNEGRLAVVSRVHCPHSAAVAVGVQYQMSWSL